MLLTIINIIIAVIIIPAKMGGSYLHESYLVKFSFFRMIHYIVLSVYYLPVKRRERNGAKSKMNSKP